jgi:two-component system LytT family response regulator
MNKPENIKAILVDDAKPARELLRLMLTELTPDIHISGEAENVEQAVKLIRNVKPDIIFLDIKMPGKSGLQLFDEFENNKLNCEVIFTTAYNEYAIQAFKLSAVDYLLKPINENELREAFAKAVSAKEQKQNAQKYTALATNLQHQKSGILAVPLNYGYEYVAVSEIEFIEADRAYSYIHLNDGTHKLVSKNMGYFEDALQHFDTFIKPHRSYFVNIAYIQAFYKKGEGGEITFKSGKKAEVSRNYRKNLMERL